MKKRDGFTNAIYYELKLTHRHLKEMRERLEETALIYENVDLSPMVMMIQIYQSRIDTFNKTLRLYRKHVSPPAEKPEIRMEQP